MVTLSLSTWTRAARRAVAALSLLLPLPLPVLLVLGGDLGGGRAATSCGRGRRLLREQASL